MKKYKGLLVFVLMIASFLFLGSTKCFAENNLSKDPIHSFTFDTDIGTTVVDSVAGSTVVGTATGTTLINGYDGTGKARHFKESNIAFNDKVIPIGAKAISFKIRKEAATGSMSFIFGNQNHVQDQYGIWTYIDIDGKLVIGYSNAGSSVKVKSSISICDNHWHDILYTWDGTTTVNTVKLYVDDLSTPNSLATSQFIESNLPTYNLYIGSLANFPANDQGNYVGDLDNFKVYNFMYLNAPSTVTATAIQDTKQVNISWKEVPGAISYNVYRTETSGKDYKLVGSSNTSSFIDNTVPNSGKYYYVVTANRPDFESIFSNEVSVSVTNPSSITGNRAILEITLINGKAKEYDLSASEIDAFINWYDGKSGGTGKSYFAIRKNSNVKPFLGRKEYLRFDTIESFEIKDYNDN